MAVITVETLKTYLKITDNSEDALLSLFLDIAQDEVLHRRHPFGFTDIEKTATLERYSSNILKIAVYFYLKKDAEGEVTHNENGMNRTYESADVPSSYLFDIVPMIKAW